MQVLEEHSNTHEALTEHCKGFIEILYIHSNNRRVGVTSTQGVFQLCLLLKLSMLAVFVYFCCVLTFEIHAVTLK
jgi:hypothetical protein